VLPDTSVARASGIPAGGQVQVQQEVVFTLTTVDGAQSRTMVTPRQVPPPAPVAYHNVKCNTQFAPSNTIGQFTYQHPCGGTSLQWGYKIGAPTQAIITSNVREQGVQVSINGVSKKQGTGHPGVPKDYQFHGSNTSVPGNAKVILSDYFTFTFSSGGQSGNGSISWSYAIQQTS
jgi:hypothetical protein